MKKAVMVVDLQYGSCGKGQVAGTVGRVWEPDTAICANGPNAGHTYCWTIDAGEDTARPGRIMHTVMPVCAILPSVKNILIGPGAVIDPERLAIEIQQSARLLQGKTLYIHPNVSIVSQAHRDAEKSLITIGSTMKGTAEATISKLRREPATSPVAKFRTRQLMEALGKPATIADLNWVVDDQEYDRAVDRSERIMIEGAQGHSLSIHSQFYPYCTSRDVSTAQILADCRLPFPLAPGRDRDLGVIGVARTYPIRVANRYDTEHNQVGWSGGHYPDQRELTWEELDRAPELTTVTRLPRRIFTFSKLQLAEACRISQPTTIALTFCDYLHKRDETKLFGPELFGPGVHVPQSVIDFVDIVENAAGGRDVGLMSYGPTDQDMYSPTYEGPDSLRLGPVEDFTRWLP